jgi:(p)ppGpp synthase/HD superfamily hydrolase
VVAGTQDELAGWHQLALDFLADAYDGVPMPAGKGLEHAVAVAHVLSENDYDERLQLVALLHDVVEDTARGVVDLRPVFGDAVADMVGTLSEDPTITAYARRKRALREQIAAAGPPLVDIALADKIAILRHARDTGTRVPKRKLTHYRATLALARASNQAPRLLPKLEALLAAYS